ncbi:MAG: hypothetical protein ABL931_22425 [Usitatibacteraceae bacterium]
MAKPNYNFAKRQRELAKKAKKEEKLQRKAAVGATEEGATEEGAESEGDEPAETPGETKPAA